MHDEIEKCQILKNRINVLNEWHLKYLDILKIVNDEHPDYLKQPVDLNTIENKLGTAQNDIKSLKNYLENATDIYLSTMKVFENLKDNYKDYVDEKRFFYDS